VDPIGACVGLRGTRIQVISRELRGEKIDIIEWSHDASTFVARALSPAKVSSVTIAEPGGLDEPASALVVVADNQLSLAIGKKGQNARLAAKLTGMRIDIKSESELELEDAASMTPAPEPRSALLSLPAVSAEIADALARAGIDSPAAIVGAGIDRLREVPEIGERSEMVYAEAEAWMAQQGPEVREDSGADGGGDAPAERA
jgi:N utilization substance protein A